MIENTGVLAVKLETLHSDVGEIKSALNKLSDAITKLALVEQQQSQTASAMERAFVAIEKVERRVAALEKLSVKSADTSVWVDRAVTAAVVAFIGIVAKAVGVL